MKAYIYLSFLLIFFAVDSYSQKLPDDKMNLPDVTSSVKNSNPITETGETESPLYYFLSYGNAPNEVIFNKDFDRSYVSAMSHDFSAGISIIGREERIMGDFTLSGFYQFSKQHSLKSGDFRMEYSGFGIKAPRASVGAVLGKVEIKMFFPIPFDLSWFKFNMDNFPGSFSEKEINFLKNYNDNIKFSSGREYGLGFNFGKHFSLNLGYECRFFHPSYKFLQQQVGNFMELSVYAVSYALSYARIMSARTVLDGLTGVSLFLFPEAVSFGILQLKKNSINWPFSSEAPLYYNSLKISANVYF